MKIKTLTTLYTYDFNLRDEGSREAYATFCAKRKAEGLTKFAAISGSVGSQWIFHRTMIQPLNAKQVQLEMKHLFNNQWNSGPTEQSENGLRLFDWSEPIYPNSDIKRGYWLEQTDEMQQARKDRHVCGYCGKQYRKPEATFCEACLDSPYLKKEDLHLLRLKRIYGKSFPTRETLSGSESEYLEPKYTEQQTTGKGSRAAAKLEQTLRDITAKREKGLRVIEDEYLGMKWLLDNDYPLENVIYYDHTEQFCIGWRSALSEEVAQEWENNLAGAFPCEFKIKRA